MLLERIRKDTTLAKYLSSDCEEEGVCVVFDEKVANDSYVIIKVDQYYNAEVVNPPPSPDCLIIQQCVEEVETYALTIVELKSISSSRNFTVDNMTGKFETCLNDFIKNRFKHYFNRDYVRVRLLFVSRIEKYKRDAGLRMRILTNKRFVFRGKSRLIESRMPTPTIKPCY